MTREEEKAYSIGFWIGLVCGILCVIEYLWIASHISALIKELVQ